MTADVAYDETGRHVYGIAYPWGSLSGTGTIAGEQVACIAPERMFRFKAAYPPAPKDLRDVAALAERFGFTVPETHRQGLAAPRSGSPSDEGVS